MAVKDQVVARQLVRRHVRRLAARAFQYIDPSRVSGSAQSGLLLRSGGELHRLNRYFRLVAPVRSQHRTQADNIQRLAFRQDRRRGGGPLATIRHHHKSLGVPGQFLDFPDLAVGAILCM